MYTDQLLLGVLAAINIFSFFFVAYDKRKAMNRDDSRVPEGQLFMVAILFGALGTYLGMQVFRHKTRRWYFQVGIPLLILQNASALYLLRNILISIE